MALSLGLAFLEEIGTDERRNQITQAVVIRFARLRNALQLDPIIDRHRSSHTVGRKLLDERGIAVRAGHHCARPVCVRYGIPATTRASFGIYTTTDEIDALVAGIQHVQEVFGR